MESRMTSENGRPVLQVAGKTVPAAAYVTYFTERAQYEAFAKAGYGLFSVCAYFTALPFNENTGFSAAEQGFFDIEGKADFSVFDREMEELLAVCPEAMVFPRVYVSMPRWWLKKHPNETIPTKNNPEGREAHYSRKFREDAGDMLRQFIAHVKESRYADAIIGYQISGGMTQEWFYFDLRAGLCQNAEAPFARWLKENGLAPMSLPSPDTYGTGDKAWDAYLTFANYEVADTVAYLSHVAKEAVGYRQVIGAFYGYCLEVHDPRWGTHALGRLLSCEDVDFYCSPISYGQQRKLGIDWSEMVPVATIREHGKLYMTEADVRTHLSTYPDEARPSLGEIPEYHNPIWKGGPALAQSAQQVRKAFVKCLTNSGAFWWFDMWGGWYDCPELMAEMARFRKIMDMAATPGADFPRPALFVDETLYRREPGTGIAKAASQTLCHSGLAVDTFLLSDFDRVYRDRKAVYFVPSAETPEVAEAKKKCKAAGVPYYEGGWDSDKLRTFTVENGIGCYGETDDPFYAGFGFVGLHAAADGCKVIHLPIPCLCTDLFGNTPGVVTDTIRVELKATETILYRVEAI